MQGPITAHSLATFTMLFLQQQKNIYKKKNVLHTSGSAPPPTNPTRNISSLLSRSLRSSRTPMAPKQPSPADL